MSVHFWEFYALGERQLRGYVCKDGLMAEITTLDLRWQGDAQFNHTAFQADIVDEAGRHTRVDAKVFGVYPRSEEHTSELQSLMRISYAVFCLKNKKTEDATNIAHIQDSPT